MTILTTILNGSSNKDIRDTLNNVLARLIVLEGIGIPAAPTNTVAPAITGTAQEGQVLTVSNGTWTGSPTGYAYQWKRGGVAISGAVNQTRTLASADVGAVMTCTVTATNATGSTGATSNGTAVVIAAATPVPANTAAPTVTGTLLVGSTLTTTNGTWTNGPTGYGYQWRRDGVDINGATANTYVLVTADRGTSISCRVAATNAGGTTPAVSNATYVPAPSLALSSAVVQAEGNSGTSAFNWTLTLNRDGSTEPFPYSWATAGNGANPANAADFGGTFPSGSGTFAAGETSKPIPVLVQGDTAVEPDETFLLTVTAANLNTVTSTGTISNDDTTPSTLPNYRSALAAARAGTAGPLVINYIGDSTVVGAGAGTGTPATSLANNARGNSVVQQLGNSFAANGLPKNGADILGFGFAVNTGTAADYAGFNTSFTPGGWSYVNNLVSLGGNMWNAQSAVANSSWTGEGRPFNRLAIYYVTASGLGTFRVKIDGVAQPNIVTNGAQGVGKALYLPSLGNHTVEWEWVSGSVYIIFMESLDTTNKASVRIRNLGQGSAQSATLIDSTQPWRAQGVFQNLEPASLHIIEGGVINDWLQSAGTAATTSNLTTLISLAQTGNNADVVLTGPTRSNPSSTTIPTATQDSYAAAMQGLANGTTKVFYDLKTVMGDYVTANGNNRMYDDKHPNLAGYGAEAAAVYGIIS